VVVNHRHVADQDGKVSTKPLSTQEMAQINTLVKEAIGFNIERGDTLNIVNASFTPIPEAEAAPIWKDPGNIGMAKEIGKNLLLAGLILYLVLGVLRPTLRNLATLPPARERAGEGQPSAKRPRAGAEVSESRPTNPIFRQPRTSPNRTHAWSRMWSQWVGTE
jgi:flagellar M-ring protein FliF